MHKPDIDGEIAKELAPDIAPWAYTVKTNAILADIFDMLAMINANIVALGSGKRASKPKPYERPRDNKKQHIGKNALPPNELRAFFDKKRKERARRRNQQEVNGQ